MTSKSDDYLVWSNEHRAWWHVDRQGYTRDIAKAGHYSRSDAIDIVSRATYDWSTPPNELPVKISDLPADAIKEINRLSEVR